MTDKIRQLTNAEMEKITGGGWVGYTPEKPCPICSGELKAMDASWETHTDGKRYRTICQKCGEIWYYSWNHN